MARLDFDEGRFVPGARRTSPRGAEVVRGERTRTARPAPRQLRLDLGPAPVEVWNREEEPLRVGMPGVGEDELGPAHLDDSASLEDEGPIADVVAEGEIVGDEEDPEPASAELPQEVEDVDPGTGVEHADDLVGDEVFRLEDAGYRHARANAGLPTDHSLEVHGPFTREAGVAGMRALLERRPDIDAVFAASDLLAAGALHVIIGSGRRVPDDIALVGFDDSPLAETLQPPLTSVRQPIEEMGREMTRILIGEIAATTAVPRRVVLSTELVVRASSAPRAVGAAGHSGSDDVRIPGNSP